MVFIRDSDLSIPKVWDTWEKDGRKWIVQDLAPQDQEEVIKLYIEHFCPDEVMCQISGICEDQASLRGISDFWRECMSQKMSLACYEVTHGKKLVGANICLVNCRDDDDKQNGIVGEVGSEIYSALVYIMNKVDMFKIMEDDKYLGAMGLVVHRDHRGAKIGERLLNARRPLCKQYGIRGTATIFTGPASQKTAANCGFETAVEVTWREMADAGFKYPRKDNTIKYMYTTYY